ncbi:MAG: ATP-dependent DNA helicase RecG, partial [Trebonia sp.]
MTTLRDPLVELLGPKTGKKFADALGLRTVGDLLRHYPRRYHTRGELTSLGELREGEHVTVLAQVDRVARHPMRPQRDRLEVTVTDGTARLTLTFFGTVTYHQRKLQPGELGLFAGKVSTFRGQRQLVHPEYDIVPQAATTETAAAALAAEYATEIIPIYPASAKVSSWTISKAVGVVLDTLDVGEDPLPDGLRDKYGLWPLGTALRAIHRPDERDDIDRAKERLRWDEAFVMQTALAQRRRATAAMPAVPRPRTEDGLAAEFDKRLPFSLTDGQRGVGETIATDLACAYPMNRLLQGEVGSGKTVVAVRAMLQVVDAGGQAVLLAPTEVLAQQHYRSITELLGPLAAGGQLGGAEQATQVALLTGSTGVKARRATLTDTFTGDAGILIGTHALLEDRVQFNDLGLVVIDEQHRFGVEQRDALREKAAGARPHVLVMTATPIPRTVAMTVFGDLEVSTLAELPAGRSPIATHVVPALERPHFLERAWERVREEVAAGRQAYVVCPRIGGDAADGEDTDVPDAGEPGADEPDTDILDMGEPGADGDAEGQERRPPLAVLDVAPALEDGPLNGLRLGVMHGKLHPDEKEQVMAAFKEGRLDVLISTTVIEVGVDVPNATVMVIMDGDRFGVSQLHQLRGRV